MSTTSSTPSEQRLERLETKLDFEMQEMRELFAAMSSNLDQLIEDRSTNTKSGLIAITEDLR